MPVPRHAQPLTDPADLAAVDDLLTYEEAARKLRCSRKTVQRLVADGKLRAVTYYSLNRIAPHDLRDFILRHSHRLRRVTPPRSE